MIKTGKGIANIRFGAKPNQYRIITVEKTGIIAGKIHDKIKKELEEKALEFFKSFNGTRKHEILLLVEVFGSANLVNATARLDPKRLKPLISKRYKYYNEEE